MTRNPPHAERRIFVSYARADAAFANQLVADLEAAGHDCWIDRSSLKGGDKWVDKILAAIRAAPALIVIATPKALESEWVEAEIRLAKENKKQIIPLLKEDVSTHPRFSFLLGGDQAVPFFGRKRTLAFADLLQALPTRTPRDVPRELALTYLERLKTERLSEIYTPLGGTAWQGFHQVEIQPRFELLPVDENGRLLPETRPVDDVIAEMRILRRVMLLGEPGGGKTTTLWKLAAELGEAVRSGGKGPLPLLIRLGNWTTAAQPLRKFIAEQLGNLGAHLDVLLGKDAERAALLLDGLNELPVGQRETKYPEVQRFIEEHAHLLAVVSCRELDYTLKFGFLGFPCINIAPLDPVRIRDFAGRYLGAERGETFFWKLAGAEAQSTRESFMGEFADRLADAERVFWTAPELPAGSRWGYWYDEHDNSHWQSWLKLRETPSSLMALARNPYMLLMLTSVYARRDTLPENRGKLFQSFVQNLLDREREGKRLRADEQSPLIEGLAQVAAAMQRRRASSDNGEVGETLIALPQAEVQAILGDRLLYLASSASLLSLGKQVRFTHQLLQEYFAAQFLDNELRAERVRAADLWPPDRWWQRNNWEETAFFLAGLHKDDCTPVVEWLAEANPEIAAQCLTRSGAVLPPATRAATLERLRAQWLPRLTDLQREPQPAARAAIGRALGLLDLDNRPGIGLVADGLPDVAWVEIPGGAFKYGEANLQYAAKPQTLTLPTFYLSRYPVTYAQYQAFLDAPDGYADARWFAGLAANENERQMAEQYFKFTNHPRESVNWYEAIAFCRWLSWRWGGGYDLKKIDEWAVRLPTEFEWEKAARGTDGRLYPYAGEFDVVKGNVYDTGIGQASAVGIFPNGASPYGVEEMSSNVWEWSLSDHKKPQFEARKEKLGTKNARILRGGAWFYFQLLARAIARNIISPGDRNYFIGFRLWVARPPH